MDENILREIERLAKAVDEGRIDPEQAEQMIAQLTGEDLSKGGRIGGSVTGALSAGLAGKAFGFNPLVTGGLGAATGALIGPHAQLGADAGVVGGGMLGAKLGNMTGSVKGKGIATALDGILGAGAGYLAGDKLGDVQRPQAYKEAVGYADGGWLGRLFSGVPRNRARQIDEAVDGASAPTIAPPIPMPEERITPSMAEIMKEIREKNPPIVGYADGGYVDDETDRTAIIARLVAQGKLDPEIAQEIMNEDEGSLLGAAGGAAVGGLGGIKFGGMAAPGGILGKAIGGGLGALGGGLAGYEAGPAAAGTAGLTAAALSPAGRAFFSNLAPKVGSASQAAAEATSRAGEVASVLASHGLKKAGKVGRDALDTTGRMADVASVLASHAGQKGTKKVSELSARAADAITDTEGKIVNSAKRTYAKTAEVLDPLRKAVDEKTTAAGKKLKKTGEKLGKATREAGEKAGESMKEIFTRKKSSVDDVFEKALNKKLDKTYNQVRKELEANPITKSPTLSKMQNDKWSDAIRNVKGQENKLRMAKHMYLKLFGQNNDIDPKVIVDYVLAKP